MKSFINKSITKMMEIRNTDTCYCFMHMLQWPIIFMAALAFYICAVARALLYLLLLRPDAACREMEHILPEDL